MQIYRFEFELFLYWTYINQSQSGLYNHKNNLKPYTKNKKRVSSHYSIYFEIGFDNVETFHEIDIYENIDVVMNYRQEVINLGKTCTNILNITMYK